MDHQTSRTWPLARRAFVVAGAVFPGVSPRHAIAHLDRQLHAIASSFIPAVGARDATEASGCQAATMGPSSAVLLTGVPSFAGSCPSRRLPSRCTTVIVE